jgi:hypothetical protein
LRARRTRREKRTSEVQTKPMHDGPYIVTGPVTIVDADGSA